MFKPFLSLVGEFQSYLSDNSNEQVLVFGVLFLDLRLGKINLNFLAIRWSSCVVAVIQKVRIVIKFAVDGVFDRWDIGAYNQHIINLSNSSGCLSLCVDWIPLYCKLKQTACVTDWANVVVKVTHAFTFLWVDWQPSEVWSLALNSYKCWSGVHYLNCVRLVRHSNQVQWFWL